MIPWLLRTIWGGFTCIFNRKAEAGGCEVRCVAKSRAEQAAESSALGPGLSFQAGAGIPSRSLLYL